MRAWTALSQDWKLGSVAVTLTGPGGAERLEYFALQHLDLLLRRLQALLAEARELEPALVRRKRLLQTQVAGFHALDHPLELGKRLLEALLGR